MHKHSTISTHTLRVVYPYILIFGFYIIFNGHKSPGGGFQGGAILASVFIIHYLVNSHTEVNLKLLTIIEKLLYFLLVITAIVFIIYNRQDVSFFTKQIYMIIMNLLIGLEVFCGLSVIFFRFINFESR